MKKQQITSLGFDSYHPAINLIYFIAVITGTLLFNHPVYLGISLTCAFLYSAKRTRGKSVFFHLCLIPLAALFALWYSGYHHFGVTNLGRNLIGNQMTLESLLYGLVLGLAVSGAVMWMTCVYSVFSTDKTVYLFGRISPRLSLFLAILLRLCPRIKEEAKRIHTARRAIGLGIFQGSLLKRIKNMFCIFSMLITWTIEAIAQLSESMQSRGSTLRGRTAFSIYRFDNRDRAIVISIFFCLTLVFMSCLLQQTVIQYNPSIILKPASPMSCLFLFGYAALCLIPMGLELFSEWSFRRAQSRI